VQFWFRLNRATTQVLPELAYLPSDSRQSGCFLFSAEANELDQLGRYLVQRQDKINVTGLDRSFRHAEILRSGPVLRDNLAAALLDDLHPE